MAVAEVYLTRLLKVPIEALRNPDQPLIPQIDGGYRLKTLKTTGDGLLPTLAVAQSTAETLIATEMVLPSFASNADAEDVRRDILAHHQTVNLPGLLAWAWEHGMIIAHLKLPEPMKPFAGVALILDDRPVILLASRYDSPAWLVFPLAHEIAHILLGHVVPDKPSWDEEVGLSPTSPDEIEANKFALTVLTGRPELEMHPVYGLTGPKLAAQLQIEEPYTHVDAGTAALIYGYSADRMNVAQRALKELGLDKGGQAIIDRFLQEHLPEHVPL